MSTSSFEQLVEDAASVSVDGWDFSWLDGRAREERPSWGFTRNLASRIGDTQAMLDVQTGDGEVLAEVLERATLPPDRIAATESWPPNADLARSRLEPLGVHVELVANDAAFPFDDCQFDLVVSRHPVETRWDEIARVLTTGGHYFAQHVGAGSNRELTDFMMGAQPVGGARSSARAVEQASAAGLEVVQLQEAILQAEFFDVGAVIYFLRKVVWTVPDFTVERYRDRLEALHTIIETNGRFLSHAQRFLVEAVKPG